MQLNPFVLPPAVRRGLLRTLLSLVCCGAAMGPGWSKKLVRAASQHPVVLVADVDDADDGQQGILPVAAVEWPAVASGAPRPETPPSAAIAGWVRTADSRAPPVGLPA